MLVGTEATVLLVLVPTKPDREKDTQTILQMKHTLTKAAGTVVELSGNWHHGTAETCSVSGKESFAVGYVGSNLGTSEQRTAQGQQFSSGCVSRDAQPTPAGHTLTCVPLP